MTSKIHLDKRFMHDTFLGLCLPITGYSAWWVNIIASDLNSQKPNHFSKWIFHWVILLNKIIHIILFSIQCLFISSHLTSKRWNRIKTQPKTSCLSTLMNFGNNFDIGSRSSKGSDLYWLLLKIIVSIKIFFVTSNTELLIVSNIVRNSSLWSNVVFESTILISRPQN